MQGKHSFGGNLTPANENINQIKKIRERLRSMSEENNLFPTKLEEGTNQLNQTMATGRERQLVMKEYA